VAPRRPGWQFENEAVLHVVQGLVGLVPSWLQAVGIEVDEERRAIRIVLAVDEDAPEADQLIDDLLVDIDAPSGGAFELRPEVWRGHWWTEGPVSGLRMVFARRPAGEP
jgi:hypothetical protein